MDSVCFLLNSTFLVKILLAQLECKLRQNKHEKLDECAYMVGFHKLGHDCKAT